MTYDLFTSDLILEQVYELRLSQTEKELVQQKLNLALENPFRNKAITAPGLTKIFEIKITLKGIYKRIIYSIDNNTLRAECIIDRKNDFNDLLKLLKKARET